MTEHNLLECPTGKQWKQIGVRPHHGICVPLFSLRTQKSCGIGEYTDLFPLIDWVASLGFDLIQLLPLNDGGPETSPYSSLSAFALNPLCLGLAELPFLDKMPEAKEMLAELGKLNSVQRISYQAIQAKREAFLRKYFQSVGSLLIGSREFMDFVTLNPWLTDYALFKTLKILTQWQRWEEWTQENRDPSPLHYQNLVSTHRDEILYHSLLQFLSFQQLERVKKYAESKGLLLKGDIPILINGESADVWRTRAFFNMEFSAGAPPDMYAADGQKWGFPIYDWSNLEQTDYQFWKQRLKVAEHCYHLYRLDHVVGFYRIWAIPLPLTAREGHFIPSDPAQWIPQGDKILRMLIANSSLLPIGEDLGIVTPEVRQNLCALGVCGTKVMRWERYWHGDASFIPIHAYPVESMTTVSTHDSETLSLWWRNQPQEAAEYARSRGWEYNPHLSLDYRKALLWDSHHTTSIFHVNLLQEYLALVPDMTWPDPEDERINVPGVISERNWTYRFRPSLEEIALNEPLADLMRDLIK